MAKTNVLLTPDATVGKYSLFTKIDIENYNTKFPQYKKEKYAGTLIISKDHPEFKDFKDSLDTAYANSANIMRAKDSRIKEPLVQPAPYKVNDNGDLELTLGQKLSITFKDKVTGKEKTTPIELFYYDTQGNPVVGRAIWGGSTVRCAYDIRYTSFGQKVFMQIQPKAFQIINLANTANSDSREPMGNPFSKIEGGYVEASHTAKVGTDTTEGDGNPFVDDEVPFESNAAKAARF